MKIIKTKLGILAVATPSNILNLFLTLPPAVIFSPATLSDEFIITNSSLELFCDGNGDFLLLGGAILVEFELVLRVGLVTSLFTNKFILSLTLEVVVLVLEGLLWWVLEATVVAATVLLSNMFKRSFTLKAAE